MGDKTGIDFPTTANVPIQHEIRWKSLFNDSGCAAPTQKQIVIASVREMDCVFFFINYYDITIPHSLMGLSHFLIVIVALCKVHFMKSIFDRQSQKFTRVWKFKFWKRYMKKIGYYR